MIEHFCIEMEDLIPFDETEIIDGEISLICSKCGSIILISSLENISIIEEI